MSMFGKIFENGALSESDQHVLEWAVSILLYMEKAGPALSLSNCCIHVIQGNLVQIWLQDWYDDFIPRFGKEQGLDKYFNLEPITPDIYGTRETPRITGNPSRFINAVESEINGKHSLGYHLDQRKCLLEKSFHE